MSQLDLFGAPRAPANQEPTKPQKAREPPADLAATDDDRCFVIGCVCLKETTVKGRPVCSRCKGPELAAIMATGDWPGLYRHNGKDLLLATTRSLSEGHASPPPRAPQPGGLFRGKPKL